METSEVSLNPFHDYCRDNEVDQNLMYPDAHADFYFSARSANRFTASGFTRNLQGNQDEVETPKAPGPPVDLDTYLLDNDRDLDVIEEKQGDDTANSPAPSKSKKKFREINESLASHDGDVPSSCDDGPKNLPQIERRATIQSMISKMTTRSEAVNKELNKDEDDPDNQNPWDRAWVDKINPRLMPDWIQLVVETENDDN